MSNILLAATNTAGFGIKRKIVKEFSVAAQIRGLSTCSGMPYSLFAN